MSYFGYDEDCSAARQAQSDISDLRHQVQALEHDLRMGLDDAEGAARRDRASLSGRISDLEEQVQALQVALDEATNRVAG